MAEHRDDKAVVVIERSDGGVGSFLLGLAIGAGVALLFAPKTGDETRADLKTAGRRLRETAADRAEDLQDLVGGGYDHTKERVEHGFETARQVIDDRREDAKDAIDAGKAAVHSARDELEKRLSTARTVRGGRRAKNGDPVAVADDEDDDDEA